MGKGVMAYRENKKMVVAIKKRTGITIKHYITVTKISQLRSK